MWEVCTALSVVHSPGFEELGKLSRLELWSVIRRILFGNTERYEIFPESFNQNFGIEFSSSSRKETDPSRISFSEDEIIEPCFVK